MTKECKHCDREVEEDQELCEECREGLDCLMAVAKLEAE